jgi:hypothetical protein
MQFPITRERLQNYRKNEAVEAENRRRVDVMIKDICYHVEVVATRGKERTYKVDLNYRRQDVNIMGYTDQDLGMMPPVLDVILSKLHELFPDSTIQVDPLKTYILIDWS